MVNDVYQIGMGYAKHKRIAAFFSMFFKPRLDEIIKVDAPEKDLIDVMILIKGKIDPVLKEIGLKEDVDELQDLNDPKTHAIVKNMLLKDNMFVKEEEKQKALALIKDLNF